MLMMLPRLFCRCSKLARLTLKVPCRIDVDDGAKAVVAQLRRGAQKVAGRAVDQQVEAAKGLGGLSTPALT